MILLLGIFRDPVIKHAIIRIGSQLTGTQVKLQEFSSTLSGKIRLQGFSISNPPGYSAGNAIELQEIRTDINVPSLFKKKKIIELISVRGMSVNLEAKTNGTNLGAIQDNMKKFTSSGNSPEKEKKQPEPSGSKKAESDPEAGILIVKFIAENNKAVFTSSLLKRSADLPLPPLHLTDIGGKSLKETAFQLFSQLFSFVSRTAADAGESIKSALSRAGLQLNDAAVKSGRGLSETTKNIGKQIRKKSSDFFKSLKFKKNSR